MTLQHNPCIYAGDTWKTAFSDNFTKLNPCIYDGDFSSIKFIITLLHSKG